MLARFGTHVEYTERNPHGFVNLERSEVQNDDLRDLIYYPGFAGLNLDWTSISDAGMPHVGEMSRLEDLRLSDTLISDDGLSELTGLPKLERLSIGCHPGCFPAGQRPVSPRQVRRNQITNVALGYLTEFLALRSLNLRATRVNDNGLLRHVPDLPSLQSLSLAYLDITSRGLVALDSLAWIERLDLTHTAVGCEAIVSLVNEKAHTLRRLDLSNTAVDDSTLASFPHDLQLLELALMDTHVTDLGCEHLPKCQWLTKLQLDLTDVTDDGIRILTDCEHIRTLGLYKTKVTDTSLVWLSDSVLEHLGLAQTQVTDAGMPVLAEYSELKSLDFRSTAITDKGLRFLSQALGLEQLYLERTQISNAGLGFLLELPLESLSLNPSIDDVGLEILCDHERIRRLAILNAEVSTWQPLARLERLEVLLVDDSVPDVSSLRSLRSLKILMLWGDGFSATSLGKLRNALPECHIVSFPVNARADCEFRKLCRYG